MKVSTLNSKEDLCPKLKDLKNIEDFLRKKLEIARATD